MSLSAHPVLAIVGPTASGKSSLGIEVALEINGEIINCDSVQVYQEIEVATAKVPIAERKGIPHHLIDFVPPSTNFTAGDWARVATSTIDEIESRGRLPILVGGTGFYLRAIRDPLFISPQTNPELRHRLTKLREQKGAEYLHRLLDRIDPQAASRFFPRDWPRVQRAIEVRIQTGQSIVEQLDRQPLPTESAKRIKIIALNPPRAELYERINTRTVVHFQSGLIDEVKRLLNAGVPADSNALGAHGYRRVVEHLKGERTLENAIYQTKLDIRHYAKRQLTWFRHQEEVEWFDGFGDDPEVLEDVLNFIRRSRQTK